jgi:CubicO group peptidase (beta-lactamase class C family)
MPRITRVVPAGLSLALSLSMITVAAQAPPPVRASVAAAAQTPAPRPSPRPASAVRPGAGGGTGAWRLDPARLARLRQLLEQYAADQKIGGAVALVLQDGVPAIEVTAGWRDREARVPMSADSLFRIASQTKAVTSVAIMMLVEEGRIGLTDPVSRFIPAFARTSVSVVGPDGTATIVPAKRAITITDLLTHTAGISYGMTPRLASLYEAKGLGPAAGLGWYTADKAEAICDTMERLATLPFDAHPGEAWVYGYNTDVLGCVVERAAGVSLDEFFRTRILEPLGMRDTHFYVPADKRSRLVTVYASEPDGSLVRAPEGPRGQGHYADGVRRSFSGGAGLVSTARDYARFLEMVRRGGAIDGVRLLSPRSVALMTQNQIGTLYSTRGMGWGLGFETTDRAGGNGLEPAGAFGWAGAYSSVYRVDPDGRMVMVLMLNQLPNTSDIRSKFQTMVHQAMVPAGDR